MNPSLNNTTYGDVPYRINNTQERKERNEEIKLFLMASTTIVETLAKASQGKRSISKTIYDVKPANTILEENGSSIAESPIANYAEATIIIKEASEKVLRRLEDLEMLYPQLERDDENYMDISFDHLQNVAEGYKMFCHSIIEESINGDSEIIKYFKQNLDDFNGTIYNEKLNQILFPNAEKPQEFDEVPPLEDQDLFEPVLSVFEPESNVRSAEHINCVEYEKLRTINNFEDIEDMLLPCSKAVQQLEESGNLDLCIRGIYVECLTKKDLTLQLYFGILKQFKLFIYNKTGQVFHRDRSVTIGMIWLYLSHYS